jgi:Regulator of chromosome condensation (RCC1) repeat/Immunoglobulin I-set domain
VNFLLISRRLMCLALAGQLAACGGGSDIDEPEGAPVITVQPQPASVTVGDTANFDVVATGTGPLQYQWRRGGTAIAGATTPRLTITPAVLADTGAAFSVDVANSIGRVTSNEASLTVSVGLVAPSITNAPRAVTVTAGQTANFSVLATGSGPLAYQWLRNAQPIAGADQSNLSLTSLTVADSGAQIAVRVTNATGAVTSPAVALTVQPLAAAPVISQQPTDATVGVGQSATFSVVTSTGGAVTYQWQKNGLDIAGAVGAAYTTPATTLADSGTTFRVILTNGAGLTTSATLRLTVVAAALAPTISTQPVNVSISSGEAATFSVVATGSAPLSYQWLRGGVPIVGAISASYTMPSTGPGDSGAVFSVHVTNSAGSVVSAVAVLTVDGLKVESRRISVAGGVTLLAGLDGKALILGSASVTNGAPALSGTEARIVPGADKVAGGYHSTQGLTYLLTTEGKVLGWGLSGNHNLLGGGIFITPTLMAPVSLPGTIVSLAMARRNGFATFMLREDGTVWSAPGGEMTFDLLKQTYSPKFAQVSGIDNVVAFSVGTHDHPFAVKRDGTVWQLISTSTSPSFTQLSTTVRVVQLESLSNIAQVSCANSQGNTHCLAVDKVGQVWAWGRNANGQLGNGTFTDSAVPVRVLVLDQAVQVVAGGSGQSYAIDRAGRVYSWGFQSLSGREFDSDIDGLRGRSTPQQILGVPMAASISAGADGSAHAAVLAADGTVWSWGDNTYGQLGDGTFQESATPVQARGIRLNR